MGIGCLRRHRKYVTTVGVPPAVTENASLDEQPVGVVDADFIEEEEDDEEEG